MNRHIKNGKHLILDMNECGYMPTHSEIYELFEDIVKSVEMKTLIPPFIVKGAEHLAGLTGFCVIETSHLTIHTFVDEKYVAFDLYSCKDYDEKIVIELIQKLVKPKDIEKKMFKR
jgi:S-adenosylmethionine decarboxylase